MRAIKQHLSRCQMFIWLLIISAVFTSRPLAGDTPTGLYVLIPPGKHIPDEVFTNKAVTGVVLRGDWQVIAPQRNTLDIYYYLQQIKRAEQSGKAVSLVINNGGVNTPEWVLNTVADTLSFKNNNKFHDSFGQNISIPQYWDAQLLHEKKRLLSLLGEALAEQKALKLVSVQCANATTDDWNIPVESSNASQWQEAGYSDELMLKTCIALLDHAANAFPEQSLRMAIGRVPRALSSKPDYLATAIADYGRQHYPDRFFLQRHNLSVRTPLPSESVSLHGWQLVYDAYPQNAAQMLWPAVDTDSCRLNARKTPCDAKTTLQRVVDISQQYGFRYVEVYMADLLEQSLSAVFTGWAEHFTSPSRLPLTQRGGSGNKAKRMADNGPVIKRGVAHKPVRQSIESNLHQKDSGVYGAWNNPADPLILPSGTVTHNEYTSELLDQKLGYSLYLPNKKQPPKERLPVIYWLHGKNGNESRSMHLAEYLDRAISAGKIRPVALVFVNGGKSSFYSNAKNGRAPVEDVIMTELIPHIEDRFLLGGERRLRLLEGFSMGGFGALKLAFTYPEKFQSVAIYGGALLSRDFPPRRNDAEAFADVFGSDLEYFVSESPEFLVSKNYRFFDGLGIRIISGGKDGTLRYNRAMHKHLDKLGVSHEYKELPDVGHAPRQYYEKDNSGSFIFHEKMLKAN